MARDRPSGLPQARRAAAGPSSRLSLPSHPLSGISTSTPARHGGASMPAPMPTPLAAHLPALMEDSTFFGQFQAGNNQDETALMGMDLNYQQQQQRTHTTSKERGLFDETALYDDTVMLQQRAMSGSQNGRLPGVGLGERVFEMLMQQPQPSTSSVAAPQAVLQRMELGNSQIGRDGNASMNRRRSSIRRNERLSVGPVGTSFVEFETDVRFGDDLLGGDGQKSTTPEPEPQPEAEEAEEVQEPEPQPALQAEPLKQAIPLVFKAPERPKIDFLSQIKGFDRSKLAKVALSELVPEAEADVLIEREEVPISPMRQAEAVQQARPTDSAERRLSQRLEATLRALSPTNPLSLPSEAEELAVLPKRRQSRRRQESVSSISSIGTAASVPVASSKPAASRRKSSMRGQSLGGQQENQPPSIPVVTSASSRSRRSSAASTGPASRRTSHASTSIPALPDAPVVSVPPARAIRRRSSLRNVNPEYMTNTSTPKASKSIIAPAISMSDQMDCADAALEAEQEQMPENEPEETAEHEEDDARSQAVTEVSEAASVEDAVRQVAFSPMRMADSPARSQQGDQDPFTSIAASPQIDRTRRRGKDRLSSSVMSRRNLTNLASLSPVVEERSVSKSHISEVDKTPRTLDVKAMQAVLEARVVEEERANMEMQKRIEEMHREMEQTEQLRLRLQATAETAGQEEVEDDQEHEHQSEVAEQGDDAPQASEQAAELLAPAVLSYKNDLSATRREQVQIEQDESSSDEDIQAPVLQSFIGTNDIPEVHMQSPVRSLRTAQEPVIAAPTLEKQRSSVFDRLSAAPREERPSSQLQVRPRSRQSTTSGLTVAKPYERPSSRNSIRSADTRVERPVSRPALPHQPKSSVLPRQPVTTSRPEAQVRGRTVSVPVNFSPKATKPRRIVREKSNDDMFSRRQRDKSRGPGSEISSSIPASRAGSVGSRASSQSREGEVERLDGRLTSITLVEPHRESVMSARTDRQAVNDKEKILTQPRGFSFAQPRQHEKRKRVEEPAISKPLSKPVRAGHAQHNQPAAVLAPVIDDIARRCQQDNEAHEDHIVLPLTRQALKAQDQINESMRQEASLIGPMQELDKTSRTETLQKYLKELREQEAGQQELEDIDDVQDAPEEPAADEEGEDRQGATHAEVERHDDREPLQELPVPERMPVAKRARRAEAMPVQRPSSSSRPMSSSARPIDTHPSQNRREAPRTAPVTARQPLQPSRSGNAVRRPVQNAQQPVKPVTTVAPAAKASVTTAKPFTFSTLTREQASFQQRLASWQEREQEAEKAGRAALRPISASTALQAPKPRPYVKRPIETKEFRFASDKRMEERREFEDRLREKERILEELAVIRRAEAEAREAEEIRQMRAKQVPIANPVPRHIYGDRARR